MVFKGGVILVNQNSKLLMEEMFTQKNLSEKFDAELKELLGNNEINEDEVPGDDFVNNIINYSKALSIRNSDMLDKISFVLN